MLEVKTENNAEPANMIKAARVEVQNHLVLSFKGCMRDVLVPVDVFKNLKICAIIAIQVVGACLLLIFGLWLIY